MKKSFLLCLLMTLFTTWAVQAQSTIFFSEDFEDGSMPSGWTTDGPGAWSVGPGDYSTATGAGEGSNNARITHTVNGYVTKLITPAIDLSAASSAELSFMHIQRAWAGDYDFLAVYYRSKESEDWTLLADYSDAAAATWTQEDGIALPDLSDTYQIAFEFTDNYGYGLGIDMVQIMKPAACPKATGLTFTNVTADNATFSWDAISNVSAWNFAASTEADFPDDADKTFAYNNIPASLVSGNTVDFSWIKTLTGFSLEPNTTYYVKLQANCGADGLGDWSNVASFHTACEAFALPFSEDFEEGIDCWTMVDCKEGSYGTGINNAEKYEGSYSFKFAYNTTPPQYLISPEFVAIDKEVIVEFYYKKGGSYDETFEVGYSTTDNEVGSFTWGEEIHGQSTWEQYLETLPAGVKYVAVKYTANNQLSLYIDNFSVYAEPDCPKPTSLAVSNITAHNATFTWTGESDLGWQLCLNDGGDDEYYNVSANPFSFASAPLKAETEYTAKLRTLCEGDATSDWSNEVTFTTAIACPAPTFDVEAISNMGATEAAIAWEGDAENYTLSYRKARYVDGVEENFKTTPSGWTQYTGLYNEEEGTATLTTTTYAWSFGTGNGVFDSHERVNIYGNNQRWLVTPQFICEGSNMDFDIALTAYTGTDVPAPQLTGTDDKFMVLVSADNMQTWKVLRKWDNAGSEYVYNEIANTATGESVTLDLGDYVGQSIHVAFYGESTESNADNNLHIDNVLIGTVHEPTAWISESGITEKSKQITGLEPETKYDVKVQSNCGSDGMSEESEIISFTTTPTCVVPANLTASDITAHTATFSWNGESDYGWQLCINDGGDDEIILATTNPFTVGELKQETEYTAKLRTLCEDDAHSEWSNTVTFTTDVACPAPTNLEAELTPGDGKVASLRWAAAGSAEDWILQYSESAAFEPAQEITVNGNSFYDLDDLTPETTYFARVKALCGDEDGDSQWSEPISFTPTDAYSLTINDGTDTHYQVPIHGNYTDYGYRSQFIIPATDLTNIVWGKIKKLTFYSSSELASTYFAGAVFSIYMAEVGNTTFESAEFVDWSTLEEVYSGSLSWNGNEWTFILDNEYPYEGGNLLIGFQETAYATSYTYIYWLGMAQEAYPATTQTANSSHQYSSSISRQNFLPKMTITYTPGEAPACPKPTNVQAEYNGGNQATISWNSDAAKWNLNVNGTIIPNVTVNPYTIDCELATTYEIMVQSVCDGDATSDWSSSASFATDLCTSENQCEIKLVLTDSYGDSWNGNAIVVTDVETGVVLGEFTNENLDGLSNTPETQEFTLAVCHGSEIQFSWVTGNYPDETSYVVYDRNNEEIFSGSGAMTEPVTYTVNCSSGETPTGVEDVKNDAQVYKFVKDGNLFIMHNGKLFNAQGKFVK